MPVIIETGGKQYCVEPGKKISVERLTAQVHETVDFKNLLNGGTVTATVIEHRLAPKVVIRKFRNKSRYHRLRGHRQPITLLEFPPEKIATPKVSKTKTQTKQKES